MNATFRLRRYFRNVGLVGLSFFLPIFILTLVMVSTDSSEPIHLGGDIFLVIFPLFMVVGSDWLLLSYCRHELIFQGERVTSRGVLRSTTIDLRDVIQARWVGSIYVVLKTGSVRLAIDLRNYEVAEHRQIVEGLKSFLAPEIQVGWNIFAFVMERRLARSSQTKPGPDEFFVHRTRWVRVLWPIVALAGLAGIAAWWTTGKAGYLATPLAPVGMGVFFFFLTPTKPTIESKLSITGNPELMQPFLFLVGWFLVFLAGLGLNELIRPGMSQPDATMIVGAVVWVGVLFFEAHRQTQSQSRRQQEAADLAAKGRNEAVADPWDQE